MYTLCIYIYEYIYHNGISWAINGSNGDIVGQNKRKTHEDADGCFFQQYHSKKTFLLLRIVRGIVDPPVHPLECPYKLPSGKLT